MYNNHIYKKNEEVPCTLKNYIFSSRTYVVESVSDHVIGYLRVPSHPVIKGILRQACEQKLIVPLRYKCVYDDKLQFYYKLETNSGNIQRDINKTIEESAPTQARAPVAESIEITISDSDTEYNTLLVQSLLGALGDKIDSREKYDLAVNIISVNKKLNIDESLDRTIYNKATEEYQTKFWTDDILPFCNNGMVKQAWKDADEEGRCDILRRLGITDLSPKVDADINSVENVEECINNGSRQTHQVEQEAAVHAINERRTRQNNLNRQQQTLKQHSEELNNQRAALRRQQHAHAVDTARRVAQAQSADERNRIEQESRREDIRIQEQLQHVEEQQTTVGHQIEDVDNEISMTQQEIQVIQDTASTTTIGGRGKLKINLKWQTIDDVDLHVYDPGNNHIYFSNKNAICQGVTGQLDVDANAGSPFTTSPQENIFWNDKAPIGHYKVDVNMYNKRSNVGEVIFTVTIIPELGQAKTFTGVLKTNKQTIHLVEFKYTDNGIIYL